MTQPAFKAQAKRSEELPTYVDHSKLQQWVQEIAALTKPDLEEVTGLDEERVAVLQKRAFHYVSAEDGAFGPYTL